MAKKSRFSLPNLLLLGGLLAVGVMLWNRYKDNKLKLPTVQQKERIPRSDNEQKSYYDEPEDLGVIDTNDEAVDPSLRETTDDYVDDINEASEPVAIIEEPIAVVPRKTIMLEDEPPKKATPSPPTRTYTAKKKRYSVVVGSFGNADFANEMIQRCKKAGYEVETTWKGGMKRVAVVLYCPENEVKSRLSKVQKQLSKDAWIDKK